MRDGISEEVWRRLACPSCGSGLLRTDAGAVCSNCRETYPCAENGQLDLRLRRARRYPLSFELGVCPPDHEAHTFESLKAKASPEVDFSEMVVPRHLSKELLSHFPRARGGDSLALDLGCGSTIHSEVCRRAGFQYVGLDYRSPAATILGDGHAIPFTDAAFEFVFSIAVIEHIRYPLVMMQEVHRVLMPRGRFIGTVAFMEPFHDDSYFHHSHLGVLSSLQFAGFDIEIVAPSRKWPVLKAQASMDNGLFPGVPRLLSRLLVFPLHCLHRTWWKLKHVVAHSEGSSEKRRALATAGSIAFVAHKP